jgi:hypothetical protein
VHPHHPHPDPPSLTLIDGGQSSPQGLVPLPPDSGEWGERSAPSIFPRRPGDHLELWTFNAEGTIREIRRASRKRGLNPDTAITLVCERRLACAELEASASAALDEAAMTTEAPLSMGGLEGVEVADFIGDGVLGHRGQRAEDADGSGGGSTFGPEHVVDQGERVTAAQLA